MRSAPSTPRSPESAGGPLGPDVPVRPVARCVMLACSAKTWAPDRGKLAAGTVTLALWTGGVPPAAAATPSAGEPQLLPPGLVREVRFSIAAFVIEGNTLVPTDELQETLKPLLGTGKTFDDLSAARSTVLDAYRARGYELLSVDYDGSRSRSGIHYLVVRELRIGKVRVTGLKALSEGGVRAQLPSQREGETPRLRQLARELFLFNDNPARTAMLDYTSGGPGITDVEVKVAEQQQLRGAVTLENTGTAPTGRWRIGGLVTHSNLWDRGHSAVVSYTTSNRPDRLSQYGLFYHWPLPALGDSINLFASHSDADSGRVADLFNVSGSGTIYGARYQRNLGQDAYARHVLDVGLEERRYRDSIDFFGTNLGVPVTARPLSVTYQYRLQMPTRAVGAAVGYYRNVTGGSKNDDATYSASRAGADADWHALRLNLSAQQALPRDWIASLRAEGQYADEPLISGEQFGLGGIRGVRGFAEREALGDRGWRANLEVYTPRFLGDNRALAFFDAGHTSRLNALPGEPVRESISSAGLGWRYAPTRGGPNISADWAFVLNGTPQQKRGEHKAHFSLAWWF